MNFPTKKSNNDVNISSSSLVALKAELLNKQAQIQRSKLNGTETVRIRPTKKTAPEPKRNTGVDKRAKQDEEQIEEDRPSLEKSRTILEEKAKLYARLSKDRGLLEEDTISEDQSSYLVDFQQKVVQLAVKEKRAQQSSSKKPVKKVSSSDDDDIDSEVEYPASHPDEEWVDYVDSFGRTRRCLKKDLPQFQKQDAELKSSPSTATASTSSYGSFVKASNDQELQGILGMDDEARRRQRQIWEEEEERNKQKSKLHYQDVLHQEARQHGVGFYSFSKDEEERAKQMEELEKIRLQTEAARSQTSKSASQKKAALEARLKKVRDLKRQRMGLKPLKDKPRKEPTPAPTMETAPTVEEKDKTPADEEESLRKKIAARLPQTAKIRPWDEGKEGVPSTKQVMNQSTWVDKKRDERVNEFAPPSVYNAGGSSRPPNKAVARTRNPLPGAHTVEEPPQPTITEESIIAGLAFMKQMHNFGRHSPQPVDEPEPEEEDDEDLLPPGETVESSSQHRWPSSKPTKGAAIPPPTSMDYYHNTSSTQSRGSNSTHRRNDMSESFKMGIQLTKEKR